MTTLQFYKGFSVFRTNNTTETASWLISLANKIEKTSSPMFYDTSSCQVEPNYNTVLKRVRKNNITEDNIGEIMLSQIPSVSSNVAHTVMNKYKTIANLIKLLHEDNTCLDNMKTDGGRKINKSSIENIKKYLIYNVVH